MLFKRFFLPAYLDGSMIDVETSRQGFVTCFGFVSGSCLSSAVSEKPYAEDMKVFIDKVLIIGRGKTA